MVASRFLASNSIRKMLLQTMKREWRALLVGIAILLMISNFLALRPSRRIYAYDSIREETIERPARHSVRHSPKVPTPSPPPIKVPEQAFPKPPASPSPSPVLAPTPTPSPAISLPSDYKELTRPNIEWCEERYDTKYLVTLAKNKKQYCNPAVTAGKIFCYSTDVGDNGGPDAFCVTSPTVYDQENRRFTIGCDQLPDVHPALFSMPSYWYDTGPGVLIPDYLDISPSAPATVARERKFSVLVKREEALDNLWHVLMQIESVYFSLDTMSMTTDDQGKPLYTADDFKNTQILITDDMESSVFFDLWQMLGGRPLRRLSQLSNSDLQSESLIFPLAGKSNPIWQGDWSPHLCAKSELLQVFTNRVLRHHGLKPSVKKVDDTSLILTWIDRRGSRGLVDQDSHIQKLKKTYPKVHIDVVDFANLTMKDQLATVQKTDILAGVHGAGLTHAMFLPPGATLVEIQPPELRHRGFRNEAHLAGLQYFTAHADDLSGDEDWHRANITLTSERFLAILGTAIKAMSQSGMRTEDIA